MTETDTTFNDKSEAELRQMLRDIKEHCDYAAGTEDDKYINKAFDRICDVVGVSNHWLDN